jgi:hypothetical protein
VAAQLAEQLGDILPPGGSVGDLVALPEPPAIPMGWAPDLSA